MVRSDLSPCDGRSRHALVDAFLAAAREAGFEENPDFNGSQQEGVGRYQLTQRHGLRCSAAAAYLRPAAQRPNLTVITAGLATRILFDNKRAVGVEIARNGSLQQLSAEREVLLAAGAYGSPQLLMLSGIGPADDPQDVANRGTGEPARWPQFAGSPRRWHYALHRC